MRKLALVAALLMMVLGSSVARADYGAIAYSASTGRSGASWNASCVDEARRLALNYCAAGDCAIPVWVQDGCAALAVGDGGRYGWAWAGDRAGALSNALTTCSATTTNCRVSASLCSG